MFQQCRYHFIVFPKIESLHCYYKHGYIFQLSFVTMNGYIFRPVVLCLANVYYHFNLMHAHHISLVNSSRLFKEPNKRGNPPTHKKVLSYHILHTTVRESAVSRSPFKGLDLRTLQQNCKSIYPNLNKTTTTVRTTTL